MSTTTITDVAVFDGAGLLDGRFDVSFDASAVTAVVPAGTATTSGTTVDGTGATLLPGLIDAHVHLSDPEQLSTLARFGVTTALDMGTWPTEFVTALRAAGRGADFRSAGTPIAGAGGPHARIPGFPVDDLVANAEQARRRVAARVAEGADYVKLVLEPPGSGGPDLETAAATVGAAHAAGLKVVAHAIRTGAVELGVSAGVDILTHAPLDAALSPEVVRAITVVIPTLTMMRGTAVSLGAAGLSYDHARDAVTALHQAGTTVIAGTDANDAPGVPSSVAHGSSLHDELGLLVEAGLSPLEALRSATGVTASVFGLADRGRIRPGLRADLLLVDGDPSTDVAATRRIRAVWTTGRPVDAVTPAEG
ncbi:amidohydrolase family protein [Actinoplanes sp. NPDC000266]